MGDPSLANRNLEPENSDQLLYFVFANLTISTLLFVISAIFTTLDTAPRTRAAIAIGV
jgi:hypothetical protein